MFTKNWHAAFIRSRLSRLRRHLGIVFLIAMPGIRSLHSAPVKVSDDALTSRSIWTVADGLPNRIVQSFAQTVDGYLWIGTGQGLFRFDGVQFQGFADEDPGHTITNVAVNCLLTTRDGSLLIGTEGQGLVRYYAGHFHTIPASNGNSNSFVRSIFEDRTGQIWVGGDQGLYVLRDNMLKRLDGTSAIPTIFVRAIAQDAEGRLIVGGSRLIRLDTHGSTEFTLPSSHKEIVTSIVAGTHGELWLGTWTGLFRLSADHLVRIQQERSPVNMLLKTRANNIYLGTPDAGMRELRDDRWERVNFTWLPHHNVRAIFEDTDNDLWVGTQNGLLRIGSLPVQKVSFPHKGNSSPVSMALDHDGFLAISEGVYSIHSKVAERLFIPGTEKVRIIHVLRAPDNSVWVGTAGDGAFRLSGQQVRQFSFSNNFIRVLMGSSNGSTWIGTDNGLFHVSGSHLQTFDVKNGLAYFNVTALMETSPDDLWIGTSRGLSHLHDGHFIEDETTHLLRNQTILVLERTDVDTFWIGTESAFYRVANGKPKLLDVHTTMPNNTVFGVVADDSGGIWLTGPSAVARFRLTDLKREDVRSIDPQPTAFLSYEDLGFSELYSGPFVLPGPETDKHIYLAGDQGILDVNPSGLRAGSLASVQVRGSTVDGQQSTLDFIKQPQIILNPGAKSLEISYGVIMLASQSNVRYRYMLDGLDKDWSAPVTRRTAYFTALPPGRYRFRVRAFVLGNPGYSETDLLVIQRPGIFQTWWFRILCLAALTLFVLTAIRFHIRQIRLRFEAVLKERARVAREMHDTVIQGCTSVSAFLEAFMLANGSSNSGQPKPLAADFVEQARQQLVTTIREARDAVWDLRSEESLHEDLVAAFANIVAKINKETTIKVTFEHSHSHLPISREEAFELRMIVREALSNAVTHANPKTIHLVLQTTEEHLLVSLVDDGYGFDLESVRTGKHGHYGLLGIRERAERLGGTSIVESVLGEGTHLQVIFPFKPTTTGKG